MSETVTEATPAASAPEAPAAPTPSEPTQDTSTLPSWARDAIEKANKEAAGYRTKLREVEPLAKKAQELEEAQKTEAQKVADRAAAAEKARDDAIADGLRYKAAATHGIGQDYFDLLGSGDEEAIGDRAKRVGELVAAKAENERLKVENEALRQGKPVPVSRPVEQLKPGASPTENKSQDDLDYAALFGAQS
jgi:hypothetical protein